MLLVATSVRRRRSRPRHRQWVKSPTLVRLAMGLRYDANGNVTAITPPGKPAHTFAYTPVDLEQTYDPPNIGLPTDTTQHTYNLDRQLTLVTRSDGQTLQLGYEPTGGRLSTLTLPGSQVLTYAYHLTTGNLSSITAPGSTLAYAYDGSLLTTSTWSGTVAGSVSRTYDNNFRIASQSVNGANSVTFGYDGDSLLTSAGSLSITRSPQHGLITATTLGAVTDSRTYNSFGELSQYTATASGSPVFTATYTRDKLGRITQKVETIGGVTDTLEYGYDLAGRLREVKKNGGTTATYLHDPNGNRLSVTNSGGTVLGFYDNQDRLTQYGDLVYTYTANGELLTQRYQSTPNTTSSYVYDVLGNLKSATLPDGTLIEYVVDGQNRRIGKKVNGTLVQGWLYQHQLNPVAELDGTGAVVSRFVYGTKANVPDYMVKSGVTYRIISDHLGSPRLVVNTSDGSVAQRIDYDEFGNVLTDTNPGFQPFGFAGGLYDSQTGLARFGARDYDAVTGRWTSKDPIQFKGRDPNLYAYVLSDPIQFYDPTGLLIGSLIQKGLNKLFRAGATAEDIALRGKLTDSAIGFILTFGERPGCLEEATLPVIGINGGEFLDALGIVGGVQTITLGSQLGTLGGMPVFGAILAGMGGWEIGTTINHGLDKLPGGNPVLNSFVAVGNLLGTIPP